MEKQTLFRVRRAGGRFNKNWRLVDCFVVESFIMRDMTEWYKFHHSKRVVFYVKTENDAKALMKKIKKAFPYRTTYYDSATVMSGDGGANGYVLSEVACVRKTPTLNHKLYFPGEQPAI